VKPNPRPPAEAAAAPAAPRHRAKRLLIGAGLVSIALLAAYGLGRLHGARAEDAAEQRAGAAVEKKLELEAALGKMQAEVLRLTAGRKLQLALTALDDRNFGIAQQHVTAAGRLLAKSSSGGDLDRLAAELSSAKLEVTEDVGAPRSKILGWTRQLDAALPQAEP
jgi:hypothetical protein